MKDVKFAIVTPIYRREDGRSPLYLKRTLECLKNQSYKDFTLFLIGDKYENDDEVKMIIKEYSLDIDIFYTNLAYAKERDIYKHDALHILWNCGGVNASNIGVEKALAEGYTYICRLDFDDQWELHHLRNFNDTIKETNASFLCSKAIYLNNVILPTNVTIEKYCNFLPDIAQLIHSSICVDFSKINVRYKDSYAEGLGNYPSDGLFMMDCRKAIRNNNLKSVMINSITCIHNEEGTNRVEL